MHVCLITNLAAHASLEYAIPLQVLDGVTPDISPLLLFDFYKPVYYKANESSFPSESMEKHGCFVGISENAGHVLTFKILTDDTKKIIYRSIVRIAMDAIMTNSCQLFNADKEPHPYLKSRIDDLIEKTPHVPVSMPIVHSDDLTGCTFLVEKDDSIIHRA
jgi:hypothetical protein